MRKGDGWGSWEGKGGGRAEGGRAGDLIAVFGGIWGIWGMEKNLSDVIGFSQGLGVG